MEKYLGEECERPTRTDKEQHRGASIPQPEPLIHLSITYLTYCKSWIYLCEIQDMTPTDPAFEPKLDRLMAVLHRHIDDSHQSTPRLVERLSYRSGL
jgi:hypothetical protein